MKTENVTGADFSFEKINDFDQHINMSIPMYENIWDIVKNMSTYFINDNTNVYDIGCSTGAELNKLATETTCENVKFIGYDIADNLLNSEKTDKIVKYKNDITDKNVKFNNASMILSIFTIQFIDAKDKLDTLKKVYDGLNAGGAFIITEKIYLDDGKMQDVFTFTYYDFKKSQFTSEEILGKQSKLRKIMKNNTQSEMEQMLKKVGFKRIQPFFQSLNFIGWVCIK